MDAYPDTRSFAQLLGTAVGSSPTDRARASARLEDALIRTTAAGHVAPSTHARSTSPDTSTRPALWSVARAQLDLDQTSVSSQAHLPVEPMGTARLVARNLDGKQRVEDISALIAHAILDGTLTLETASIAVETGTLRGETDKLLQSALRDFGRSALLV